MPEENQNRQPKQAPEQADPNYKETLLLKSDRSHVVL